MARLWYRLMLYTPTLLMALLALISYWLVRTAPPAQEGQVVVVPNKAPDYFLAAFTAQSFNPDGRVVRQIEGATGRHFADTKWTEIEGFRAQTYGEGTDVLLAQAQRSLSNEDATEFQLMGNAQVLRPARDVPGQAQRPRAVYRSAFLHVFATSEIAKSHMPVEIEIGKHRFTAQSMVYDNVAQTLELTGRVTGDIAGPPPKR